MMSFKALFYENLQSAGSLTSVRLIRILKRLALLDEESQIMEYC